MNSSLSPKALDLVAHDDAHFAQAPEAFFQTWKRGVELAGCEWFGDGTLDGLHRATDKQALRPNALLLSDALDVLSRSEQLFLAAMVSFCYPREGGAMLARCGFRGLSDFGSLDLRRRAVVANLLLHYRGW